MREAKKAQITVPRWEAGTGLSRLMLACLLLATLPLLLGFGPPRLVESDRQQLPVYGGQLPAILKATPPALKGVAAVIMDAATGRVVYERNGYHHIAPASITKLMTALVALDHARLTDRITITQSHLLEGSTMGLRPGEQPAVEDLLWGILLPSGNDAAQALADGVGGGSVDRFVGWMNDKARDLGLRDTQFRNPHGLDEDGHFSTAFDLALLARKILAHPLLAQIVATPAHSLRIGQRTFLIANTNRMFGPDGIPGADGVKTGLTDHAGDSVVASATRDGHRVIVATLGTNMERLPAAAALIEYAFSAYIWVPVGTPPFARLKGASDRPRQVADTIQREEMMMAWQRPYLAIAPDLSASALGEASLQPGGFVGRLIYRTGHRDLIELPLSLRDAPAGQPPRPGS